MIRSILFECTCAVIAIYPRLAIYKQPKFTSHSSRSWKPTILVQTGSESSEDSSLFPKWPCLEGTNRMSPPDRRARKGSGTHPELLNGLISFMKVESSWPNHLPQTPPLKDYLLRASLLTENFGGTKQGTPPTVTLLLFYLCTPVTEFHFHLNS